MFCLVQSIRLPGSAVGCSWTSCCTGWPLGQSAGHDLVSRKTDVSYAEGILSHGCFSQRWLWTWGEGAWLSRVATWWPLCQAFEFREKTIVPLQCSLCRCADALAHKNGEISGLDRFDFPQFSWLFEKLLIEPSPSFQRLLVCLKKLRRQDYTIEFCNRTWCMYA